MSRPVMPVHRADIQIGVNIARQRKLMGISQEQLALKVKVKHQQISKYENGIDRVTGGTLCNIAAALSCRVADLLQGVEPIIAADGGFVENISKQEGELVREFRQLRTPELQGLVITMVHALARENLNRMVRT